MCSQQYVVFTDIITIFKPNLDYSNSSNFNGKSKINIYSLIYIDGQLKKKLKSIIIQVLLPSILYAAKVLTMEQNKVGRAILGVQYSTANDAIPFLLGIKYIVHLVAKQKICYITRHSFSNYHQIQRICTVIQLQS